jgi:predicted N-acyltransferase
MQLKVVESIRNIGERTWDELARGAPPFLSYAWLDALETTGCVRPERGWMPLHLLLEEDGQPLAVAPAYLKGNSEGEFVFDYAWASFAERRLRIEYYPKIVVAVPFTPANGPRLLIAPGADLGKVALAFAEGLAALGERLGASSAHVLFPTREEANALEAAGMARRAGVQFHWKNRDYRSFDDFLSVFDAKRRHQIRRERRELGKQGIALETVLGSDLDSATIDTIFELYLTTVQKYVWGRQYLNREFFHEVCSRMGDRILLVLAKEAGSDVPFAMAFNLLGESALYGRYWGTQQERPFLHFGACYYQGIEEAITRRLDWFEPGAGGEHKIARGFEPTETYSVHWLRDRRLDRAVRDFLREEVLAIEDHVADGTYGSAFRSGSKR